MLAAVFTRQILDSPLTTRVDDRSDDGTSAEDVKVALPEADVLFTVDAIGSFIVLYTQREVELDELPVSCNAKSTFVTGRSLRASSTSIASTSCSGRLRIGSGRFSCDNCDVPFVGDLNRENFCSMRSISEDVAVDLFLGRHDCELELAVVLDALDKEESSDDFGSIEPICGGVDSYIDARSFISFLSREPVPLGRAVGVDSAPSDDMLEGQGWRAETVDLVSLL